LPELPNELRVAMVEVAGAAREGVLAMSVAVGLQVMAELLEVEIAAKAGPRHAKQPGRLARRHGTAAGSVVLGGRRVPVERPRARTLDGHEVQLATWQAFTDDDLLGQVVMERMLAGLATRRHQAAAEPVGTAVQQAARATSKSAVSRRFIAATGKALGELMSRNLAELQVAALKVDGIQVAGRCCVVALAILADSHQATGRAVGRLDRRTPPWCGTCWPTSKAAGWTPAGGCWWSSTAPRRWPPVGQVFGDLALIQRCTLHKRRTISDHLPQAQRARVDAKLARAFNDPDPAIGLRAAHELARALQREHPGAAASLREGLEEMFTARRLGIDGRLADTLTSTNPVESMLSIARTTCRNVKRWRDGQMVCRWMAAGMLAAEGSFRRLKGYKDMPALVAALARHAEEVTVQLSA
jgi:putative transposase